MTSEVWAMWSWAQWSEWVGPSVRTAAIIGAAYLVGHGLRFASARYLTRIATHIRGDWDDALVSEVTRRIPFWVVLIGAYLALPWWPLSASGYRLAVNVLSAFGVASVTFATAAVATRLVSSYGPRATPAVPVSALTQNVVRTIVTILGLLVIVRSFGYDITPYLTALGVGGLAVALALQDPLSNFFAGVFMSVSGQIRIGDYVRLDSGAEGYVADFNWRATSIRMPANNVIIVPNAKLAQATVTNFHLPSREVVLTVEVGVHYLSDLALVERVTLEVAQSVAAHVPGVVQHVEPTVRFQQFSPTAIMMAVGLRAQDQSAQVNIKHEFIKRLHARYADEQIVIPYPVTALETRRPHADSAHPPA